MIDRQFKALAFRGEGKDIEAYVVDCVLAEDCAALIQRAREEEREKAKVSREELVKAMVDRFLGWKLPEDFAPDAGISFKPTFNENTPWPMKHEPTGTNLFTATQAKAMFEHCLGAAGLREGEKP